MDLGDPLASVIPSLEGAVLHVLAHTSTPMSGSQVAKVAARGSNPGVRVALARLVSHGLVVSRPQGPSVLYTANRDHVLWPAVEHLVMTADDAPRLLREHIRGLIEQHLDSEFAAQTTVAVFGSLARRSADADSDVDLVVVTPDEMAPHHAEALFQVLVSSVQRWTGNECSVVDVTVAQLSRMVAGHDPLVDSWLRDAETLWGPELSARIRGLPWRA